MPSTRTAPAGLVARGHRRRAHRARRLRALLATVGGAAAVALLGAALVSGGRGGAGTVAPLQEPLRGPAGGPWPVWGMTHTQYSADSDAPGAAAAQRQLAGQRLLQNQHIMGWGALNPEPRPGAYDFASLDRRIGLIRRTGGVPIITLCCAPDWMKGGRPGQTDWDRLEVAPVREHWDDFAELARRVAQRYPDVRHYVVWNELKGFFDDRRHRWDHEGYTEFYNLIYDAVKSVDPAIQVGGPYVPLDTYSAGWRDYPSGVRGPWGVVDQRSLDAVEYWLRHKRGADFLVVDAATATKDRGLVTDEFTALGKLSAVSRWLRGRSDLPLWWAEWYVEPPAGRWDERHRTAVLTAGLMELARSGVATALYWNPQQAAGDCPGCLWTSLRSRDGGRPAPFLRVLQGFAGAFPAGTRLDDVDSPSPAVRVLASRTRLVVVNTSGSRVAAELDGRQVTLAPYEVRWLDRAG